MKLSSKSKAKTKALGEFSLLFGLLWLSEGVQGKLNSEISKFLGCPEIRIKKKSNILKIRVEVQHMRQGPPFHPLESSRLVESGRPGYTF